MNNEQILSSTISKIIDARSIDEMKTGIEAFIRVSDKTPKLRERLCEALIDEVILFVAGYLKPLQKQKNNVLFIPPDAAPLAMIPTCVPLSGSTQMIYEGLKRYLSRCGEFTAPMEDIVTEEEMHMVLDSAQEKFRILNIIAPVKPLIIMSLNNSHYVRNCECGIADGPASRESVIFVYHPRDVSICDRLFIFAHEVGHSLHLALTGDVEVIPDGFDEFNEALDIKLQTTLQKQEAFADVTAFAILGSGSLKKHLPHPFTEPSLDAFNRYISYVTNNYLKQLI
jgi:hypothetical protein